MTTNGQSAGGMALKLVDPPANRVLTLEDAYQQLRLDPDFGTSPPSRSDDQLILDAIDGAAGDLEGVTGWLGRALITQTWRLSLNAFPPGEIILPLPPLQSVVGINYLNAEGVEETLVAGTDYRVGNEGTLGYVVPAHGKSWPSGGRQQRGAVSVDYVAGYGDASADIPGPIRQYLKARLTFYYENRDMVTTGTQIAPTPFWRNSLENFRVKGVIRS